MKFNLIFLAFALLVWPFIVQAQTIESVTPTAQNGTVANHPIVQDGVVESRPMGQDGEVESRPMGQDGEAEGRPTGQDSEAETPRPMGQDGTVESSVFGFRSGYIHPQLSVGAECSDNIYNASELSGYVEEDNILVVTPALWFSVPPLDQSVESLRASNNTPGGVLFKRDDRRKDQFQRYQLYGGIQGEFERYQDNTAEDTETLTVEAGGSLAFRGGLILDVSGQFNDGKDLRGVGITSELDEYENLLVCLDAQYDLTEKFSLRLGCDWFHLDYDDFSNAYRDRDDHYYQGGIDFHLSEGSRVFVEAGIAGIRYDVDYLIESDEYTLLAGWAWEVTAKTIGTVKCGLGKKEFKAPGYDDVATLYSSFQIKYDITAKHQFQCEGIRRYQETEITSADFMLSHLVNLKYLWRVTRRISVNLGVNYADESYRSTTSGLVEDEEVRADETWRLAPALRYEISDWLYLDLAYVYTQCDSTDDINDYTTRKWVFSMSIIP